jgi:hypothetical protein
VYKHLNFSMHIVMWYWKVNMYLPTYFRDLKIILEHIWLVGSGNGRQLNLLEVYIAHRDQMWPSTQWLKIYTGSANRALV